MRLSNTVESPISGHHRCKSKVSANWKCPLIGNLRFFRDQNLKNNDFLYPKIFAFGHPIFDWNSVRIVYEHSYFATGNYVYEDGRRLLSLTEIKNYG